ncbi:DUF3306 domain-containing protein [Shimia aestuarii]|uniref:DUF3306 domain-containing protein n=1 Tax=Shimia aestuarii TaxID=254406 RepID=A0A1I4Q6C9_9RHOB|nr:DUF3306 domain-containing protein [Shimia aestuarii]SFM35629.1 Protein of unknown function [Shimia aestuarii]
MSRGDFWSRRMAAVEAEQLAEERALAEEAVAERDLALAEKADEEILEELGLPDPDTLSEGDDFTAFLTERVPARLKNLALRRLWTTNPVLANVDGLVDYGEDFTDAGNVIENLQTAYQVGKGMTAHVEALMRGEEVVVVADAEELDEALEPEGEEVRALALASEDSASAAAVEMGVAADEIEDISGIAAMRAPRRMRFSFNETEASA